MKRDHQILRSGLFATILLMSFSQVSLSQNFEGIIHYKFGGMNQDGMTLKYMIQNSKIRMETGNEMMGASILFLPQKSQMVILIDKMKAYMTMDMDQKTSASSAEKWEESTLEKTGITKTIAGHSCEVWEVTASNGDQTILCMAKGMGTFMMSKKMMGSKNTPAWVRQVQEEGYMPLKITTATGGDKIVTMVATKIVEKPLDDALFIIPDGYRNMSGMMQQMQKMDYN